MVMRETLVSVQGGNGALVQLPLLQFIIGAVGNNHGTGLGFAMQTAILQGRQLQATGIPCKSIVGIAISIFELPVSHTEHT